MVIIMFLLCFKIFFARVLDVSLGTFRTLVTVKGNYKDASIIGFFEVLIWFLIVKEAINTDSSSILIGISYALGFATGTYVGGMISTHFIKGNYTVQVITEKAYPDMLTRLYEKGYAISIMDIKGIHKKDMNLLFIETNKNNLSSLNRLIKRYDKNAFIVVNESKLVINGYLKDKEN